MASMIGEAKPAMANDGKHPMSTVGIPMTNTLISRQKPRPLVSPRWPNRMAPAGRDRKPTAGSRQSRTLG